MIANYYISDKGSKIKDYCTWYNNLFKLSQTPVEKFLKQLPTLMHTKKLQKGIHFKTDYKDGKFLFIFSFADALRIYNDNELNRATGNYIDKRIFGLDLASCQYFVAKGNQRYKYGTAYSYTLDLSKHEIFERIEWAATAKILHGDDEENCT